MSEKTFPVPLCSTVEGMQWLYNTATDNFIRELRDANAELDALRAEVERLRNDLRRATDLLSSAKHGYRSDSPIRAAITEFLTAQAEEEGRDE